MLVHDAGMGPFATSVIVRNLFILKHLLTMLLILLASVF